MSDMREKTPESHITNLKQIYQSLEKINCPYFNNQEIVFNSKGFRHLIYKSGNRKRDLKDIEARAAVLTFAYNILKITTTIQEKEMRDNLEFFGFIAIVDNFKIKVVVKKVGNPLLRNKSKA